jgi:hypothetical protein
MALRWRTRFLLPAARLLALLDPERMIDKRPYALVSVRHEILTTPSQVMASAAASPARQRNRLVEPCASVICPSLMLYGGDSTYQRPGSSLRCFDESQQPALFLSNPFAKPGDGDGQAPHGKLLRTRRPKPQVPLDVGSPHHCSHLHVTRVDCRRWEVRACLASSEDKHVPNQRTARSGPGPLS